MYLSVWFSFCLCQIICSALPPFCFYKIFFWSYFNLFMNVFVLTTMPAFGDFTTISNDTIRKTKTQMLNLLIYHFFNYVGAKSIFWKLSEWKVERNTLGLILSCLWFYPASLMNLLSVLFIWNWHIASNTTEPVCSCVVHTHVK